MRCAGGLPEWLTRAEGVKVLHASFGEAGMSALIDVWNCNHLAQVEAGVAAQGGAFREDVKNVTIVGIDIGRMPVWIERAWAVVAEAGIEPVHVFTEANALTFVVGDGDVVAASRALHGLVGGEIST